MLETLSENVLTIINKLLALQNQSYSIYSKYTVSCILIDDKNNEYSGVNVENASYGLTMCAERVAIGNAITNGSKKIKEIHILCGNEKDNFSVPCGACRQVISEFSDEHSVVVMWNSNGEKKEISISELLPYAFDKNYLK